MRSSPPVLLRRYQCAQAHCIPCDNHLVSFAAPDPLSDPRDHLLCGAGRVLTDSRRHKELQCVDISCLDIGACVRLRGNPQLRQTLLSLLVLAHTEPYESAPCHATVGMRNTLQLLHGTRARAPGLKNPLSSRLYMITFRVMMQGETLVFNMNRTSPSLCARYCTCLMGTRTFARTLFHERQTDKISLLVTWNPKRR